MDITVGVTIPTLALQSPMSRVFLESQVYTGLLQDAQQSNLNQKLN